jgi:branched-chain amino acid transport system ATP-binding protein
LADVLQSSPGPATAPAPPLLKVEKLSYSYGDLRVLWDVDLEVRRGEIVTVVGANGAGKSTTLRNISRLLTPASGSITFDGEDLSRLSAHEVVERGLIQVPEGRRIFPEMTVLENLRLGGYVKAVRADRARNLERAFSLFPHLRERASQLGGTLSGGEQQMLAIARGLMASPRLLLFDEPSLGLAPLLVKSMFEIIRTINQQGVTVLLVEQNVYQSLRIAHRGYALETGRIVLTGGGPELLVNEHVKKAFLGV